MVTLTRRRVIAIRSPTEIHGWVSAVKTIFRSHVFAFAAFVPFAVMLTVHRMLGLSDAMMVAPAPGQPHSLLYNTLMVLAFAGGVYGYILHAALIADRSTPWIIAKLLLLAGLWVGLIWAIS
jgi:hypothetical protein